MNSERLVLLVRKFLQCRSSINQIDDDKKKTHTAYRRETPPTPSASPQQTAQMKRYKSILKLQIFNVSVGRERKKNVCGTRWFWCHNF